MAGIRKFPSVVNTVGIRRPTRRPGRARRLPAARARLLRPARSHLRRPDVIAATRDQIAGAAGQPHHDYPDAGHFIQEDAARISPAASSTG